MTPQASGTLYNSGARLDAITLSLPIPAAAFEPVLAPLGLTARPIAGAPRGIHPLYLDLWRVMDARAELAGVDQHEWTERVGAATAGFAGAGIGAAWGAGSGSAAGALAGGRAGAAFGPLGAWGGAVMGSVVGGTLGAMSGALAGGERFSAASGLAARRASERMAHVVGSYNEAVVGIPNVVRAGSEAPARLFVLSMLTDSPASIWGERMIGAGYRKRLATIHAEEGSRYAIEIDGVCVLEGSIATEGGDDEAAGSGPPATFEQFFAQPLLGRRDDGRLVATCLDRSFGAPARVLPPARARLQIAPGLAEGVPGGRYEVGSPESGALFGMMRATDVFVRLTFPEPA